jgi:hypothetical protein
VSSNGRVRTPSRGWDPIVGDLPVYGEDTHHVAAMRAAGIVGDDQIGLPVYPGAVAAIDDLDRCRSEAMAGAAGLRDDEGVVVELHRVAARRQCYGVAVKLERVGLCRSGRADEQEDGGKACETR